MIVENTDGLFVGRRNGETLRIEAWGPDALRVRTTRYPAFEAQDWALAENPCDVRVGDTGSTCGRVGAAHATVEQIELPCVGDDHTAWRITNGRVACVVNVAGVLSLYRDGELILREHFRSYDGTISRESHCMRMEGRTYHAHVGGDFRIVQRFEANPYEKIFGMGQYQQANTNLKGCILDLEQRNSQVSVPFYVSSLGYGFLWNNPAVGRVTFGANIYEWITECSKGLDWWICVGDEPRDLLRIY